MRRVGNGQGTVKKLSGKRNKSYHASVTVGKKIVNGRIAPNRIPLGCYTTKKEARLMVSLAEGKSKSTQNNMRIMLSFCFEYCLHADILSKDYSSYMDFRHTRERAVKTPYTLDEILRK